jgi:hypothetical protein
MLEKSGATGTRSGIPPDKTVSSLSRGVMFLDPPKMECHVFDSPKPERTR